MLTGTTLGVLTTSLLTTQATQGDIVTLQVSGTVTEIFFTDQGNFDLDGSVSVGTPYQMTFVIDTNAPDLLPISDSGKYEAVSLSGQFGNYTWDTTPSSTPEIEIENDNGGALDIFIVDQQNPVFTGSLIVGGTPTPFDDILFEYTLAGFFLTDESMTALNSDALVIPEISDWGDDKVFTVKFGLDDYLTGFNERIIVRGTVDSITIPEPGAFVLIGLLITGYSMKRRSGVLA